MFIEQSPENGKPLILSIRSCGLELVEMSPSLFLEKKASLKCCDSCGNTDLQSPPCSRAVFFGTQRVHQTTFRRNHPEHLKMLFPTKPQKDGHSLDKRFFPMVIQQSLEEGKPILSLVLLSM